MRGKNIENETKWEGKKEKCKKEEKPVEDTEKKREGKWNKD